MEIIFYSILQRIFDIDQNPEKKGLDTSLTDFPSKMFTEVRIYKRKKKENTLLTKKPTNKVIKEKKNFLVAFWVEGVFNSFFLDR